MENTDLVNLSMRRETLLVIFEFLARSYDDWRKNAESPTANVADDSFVLRKPDSGERVALWRLEGEIERTLPEIFSAEYEELVASEKHRLSAELYGSKDTG
jgi:hypothetical protein